MLKLTSEKLELEEFIQIRRFLSVTSPLGMSGFFSTRKKTKNKGGWWLVLK